MGCIAGFVISSDLSKHAKGAKEKSLSKLLANFPWLNKASLTVGPTTLEVWGHGEIKNRIYSSADADTFVLIGVPQGGISLQQTCGSILNPKDFRLPWDGQVILLRISGDGKRWTMWNDWVGSMPVFHAKIGTGRIAGTLEPVVVKTAGYGPGDFFMPGLVSLLVNGHYLGDWTLFKQMKIFPADCVAEWEGEKFQWKRLWTVKPSDGQWKKSRTELTDTMYELSGEAIAGAMGRQPSWILPLSGGFDSRLIAAVGIEKGLKFQSYTYGCRNSETIHAHQVAKDLGIPWQRIPISSDYLDRYTSFWLEWFGSSLHCHGMYQVPFLERLKEDPSQAGMLHGYMGDSLSGSHCLDLISTHNSNGGINPMVSQKKVFWGPRELESLLLDDSKKYLDILDEKIKEEINQIPGAQYQQLMFLDFWNRQRLFIYYQPMMWSYYRPVAAPFMNKEYARFCLSLPLCLLEGRQLQKEMLRKFYYRLSKIATNDAKPLVLSGRYLLKQRLARYLPHILKCGPFREFNLSDNLTLLASNAIQATGDRAFWPLNRYRQRLGDLFNAEVLGQTYEKAKGADMKAYRLLQPIQTVAKYFIDKDV